MPDTTVGVIGLGIMGGPMAANLLSAGFNVIGFNRSTSAIDALVARGGRAASSVADLTRQSTAVLTMLPDSPDVEDVVLGKDGVIANAPDGLLLVDCSTIRPETSCEVAVAGRARGVHPIDAPVSGGEPGAQEGSLSIMVGGDAADVERARPILEAIGSTIVHVGPAGAGQTVKAANQLIVGGVLALVSEAIVLLEACGVDPAVAFPVLSGGLASTRVMSQKGDAMLARNFTPGFRTDLHLKDLSIVLAAASSAGVALPVTGLVAQLMAAARARGMGASDHSALLGIFEDLSGRGSTKRGA